MSTESPYDAVESAIASYYACDDQSEMYVSLSNACLRSTVAHFAVHILTDRWCNNHADTCVWRNSQCWLRTSDDVTTEETTTTAAITTAAPVTMGGTNEDNEIITIIIVVVAVTLGIVVVVLLAVFLSRRASGHRTAATLKRTMTADRKVVPTQDFVNGPSSKTAAQRTDRGKGVYDTCEI